MKIKKICLSLLVILFFLLFREIASIATNNQREALITEEDRRAADSASSKIGKPSDEVGSETKNKRGLYPSYEGYPEEHDHYTSETGYGHSGAASVSNPGYSYHPSPAGYYPGHSLSTFGFGQSGHGLSYGQPEPHLYGHGLSYGQPESHLYGHEHESHGGGHIGSHGHKALGLKSLLIPLAGIAILGAAAALSTNPVLLQLGVVNGRRRRALMIPEYPPVLPINPKIKPD